MPQSKALQVIDFKYGSMCNRSMTGHRAKTVLLFLAASAFFLFLLDLSTGSTFIHPADILAALSAGRKSTGLTATILFELRLPRALAAACGGGGLAIAGLMLQTFFRNPLAGPDVLGIASGAGLGAAVVILALPFAPLLFLTATAASVAGSLAVTVFLLILAKRFENMTVTLIAGLLTGYFLHSVTGILIRFSTNEAVRSYINWSSGSFRNIDSSSLLMFLPVIMFSAAASFALSKQCDIYSLGDEYAISMGLAPARFRLSVIIVTSAITGTVTSLCGPVSFIGIASPHLCRMLLKTGRHRFLVPGAFFSGAVMALAADLLSVLPGGGNVIPLNSVTAIIGAPVIIHVLMKGHYEK